MADLDPTVVERIHLEAVKHRLRQDQREIMLAVTEIPGLADTIAANTGTSKRTAAQIRAAACNWLGFAADADGREIRCKVCINGIHSCDRETGADLGCLLCKTAAVSHG